MRKGDQTPEMMPAPEPYSASFTAWGMRAEAELLPPGLHVVATPIGNLGDISLRALATLAAAEAVIAEDTRVTKTLLAHYGITTPLVPYHEHNAQTMRPHLLARLTSGAAMALVSDAGTPLISDPGFKLVGEAVAAGLPVTAAPGASAVMAALVLAGLPTDRFFFEGFLPPKSAARRARLADLAAIPGTLVFFESSRRIAETLQDCTAVLGDRSCAVARELTKHFETVRRGRTSQLADMALTGEMRGEIVLLVGPPDNDHAQWSDEAVDTRLLSALESASVKDAAAIVSGESGLPRRRVYARALQLSQRGR